MTDARTAEQDLVALAQHEAGHGVARLVLGMTVNGITIEIVDDGRGWMGLTHAGPPSPERRSRGLSPDRIKHDCAVVLWAGPVAEGVDLTEPDTEHRGFLAQHHPNLALDRDAIAELNPAWVTDRDIDSPWRHARAILVSNMEPWKELTTALINRRKLTGDEIRNMITTTEWR